MLQAPEFSAFEALYGSVPGAVRKFHVSTAHNFIYANNPKVACSSTKASLNMAVAARAGKTLSFASMADIHQRVRNPIETPLQVGIERFLEMLVDPDVFRFTFVRDPVSRFCSAYLSKLDKGNRAQRMGLRLYQHLGWAPDHPLSLDSFAALCRDDPEIRDFDPHWQLQRRQIAFDLMNYSFVGSQENWGEQFAAVSRRIFDGETIPVFDTRAAFGRETSARTAAREISAETRRAIEEAYAEDYRMLDEIREAGLDRIG